MKREKLAVICEKTENGYDILSPAVGIIKNIPVTNEIISGSSSLGVLEILQTQYELKLPKNIVGKVSNPDKEHTVKPVEYREKLFSVLPIDMENEASENDGLEKDGNVSEDQIQVKAPTDGIFYRKPTPDSSNYVEEGDTVKKGQVLGLVEVMKCFNQITFSDLTFPENAKITKICVDDAAEVKYQQTLFVLKTA